MAMGRLARSWDMTKTSFRVVKQDPELMWMPVLSFLASIVAIAMVLGIGFAADVSPEIYTDEGIDPVGASLAFLMYLGLAFVQVYFHAATVTGANERLAGGDPTVGSCLRGANKHLARLFMWSFVVAVVNVLLQALRQAASRTRLPFDDILVSLVGTAWNLATYFVVPILIFEDNSIGGSLKQSGSYFKKTWGETLVGQIGLGWAAGLFTFLAVLVGGLITFALFSVLGVVGLFIGLAILVLSVIVVSVMFAVASAVYKTALYRFAREGHAGGPFDDQQLAGAWTQVR